MFIFKNIILLDAVWPWRDTGIAKHPFFCCMRGGDDEHDANAFDLDDLSSNNAKFAHDFEAAPDDA